MTEEMPKQPGTAGMLANYWDCDTPDFIPAKFDLKTDYDAIVVGAGFTGLAVAGGLAQNGLSVLVLEQNTIGYGASSRNGGMVGPSFHKLGVVGLTRKYGDQKARDILRAGLDALDYCQDFFERENIDCAFKMTGRFRGARTDADMASMIAECERLKSSVGLQFDVVSPSETSQFTGSPTYKGGVVYPRDGGLHPKKLVNALAARAQNNGAHILAHTPVISVQKDGALHRVITPHGTIAGRRLVLATNGYSDQRVGPINNRIVPVDVTVTTTRELGDDQIREMSPHLQMHGETGRLFIWSRPSPDHKRFIFGGRMANGKAPLGRQQQQVAKAVNRIFPDLVADDFENIWHGKIAYTTDHAPHLNQVDGIWLIGGYCGSGVTRSLFFADKLVRKIIGLPNAENPFDDLQFPKVPFRIFAPFGARQVTKYYGWLDRRDGRSK
ncbi:FAD-binding oxidoreductase [Thalassospira sp. MA62]|nr:FAD-binding oxidoreductase [Thalassospira sp. MA62]